MHVHVSPCCTGMISACTASQSLYQVLYMLSMPGKRETVCCILVSVWTRLAELETGTLALIALCKREDGVAFVCTDVPRSSTPYCLACMLSFPKTHRVDGNHLCGLGHATQTMWFYRDLAVTAPSKQSFDMRYLTDSVYTIAAPKTWERLRCVEAILDSGGLT